MPSATAIVVVKQYNTPLRMPHLVSFLRISPPSRFMFPPFCRTCHRLQADQSALDTTPRIPAWTDSSDEFGPEEALRWGARPMAPGDRGEATDARPRIVGDFRTSVEPCPLSSCHVCAAQYSTSRVFAHLPLCSKKISPLPLFLLMSLTSNFHRGYVCTRPRVIKRYTHGAPNCQRTGNIGHTQRSPFRQTGRSGRLCPISEDKAGQKACSRQETETDKSPNVSPGPHQERCL